MNPYLILMWTLLPILGVAAVIAWFGFGVCASPTYHGERASDRTITTMAIIAGVFTVVFLVCLIALPLRASSWDCDNKTHPGERPCEVAR